MSKAILITGATGKQGGSVLKRLATHPSAPQFTLLAVTRNASSASAQKIISEYPGVKLVQGDLNDCPALFSAAKAVLKDDGKEQKIWGVYSVQISLGPGVSVETEIQQGKAIIDESIKEGASHLVYSSVDRGGNEKSLTEKTPIPHFQSKYEIEQYLFEKAGKKGERLGWTILRPVAFMDNLEPSFKSKVFLSALRDTLGDKPLQWISVEDIGVFAAKAFQDPQAWNGRAEGLAGDELTFEEMCGCFERATGSREIATYGFFGSALMWAITEVNLMVTWFKTDGYGADIQRLKREEPQLCGLERWLKERSEWAKQ